MRLPYEFEPIMLTPKTENDSTKFTITISNVNFKESSIFRWAKCILNVNFDFSISFEVALKCFKNCQVKE